jgi:hypothetical protein
MQTPTNENPSPGGIIARGENAALPMICVACGVAQESIPWCTKCRSRHHAQCWAWDQGCACPEGGEVVPPPPCHPDQLLVQAEEVEVTVRKLDDELMELQLHRCIRSAVKGFEIAAGLGLLIGVVYTLLTADAWLNGLVICMMSLTDSAFMSRALNVEIKCREKAVSEAMRKLDRQLEQSRFLTQTC